ncbi:uncharacterized protein FMAN_14182 [Fusarium mangiferae]|uniref:C2H2-type domain-containing protein n=1 Tax=Fusarium mangiferae TaxID=192010 RepID=A0A1L7UL15_FUSMA|nr:uncharacterized protein FMAN_14182 [Fusarium mangiferae]CVL08161.1 uncharacterized protein FMAN_14182 [Fusarium mangiferae]
MNGCGSIFAQQGVLKGHIRPRTRGKSCSSKDPGCWRRFRHSPHRRWHRRLYNKEILPYDIDGCPKRFLKLKTLQDHQQESYNQGKTPNRTDNYSPDDGQPPATPQLSPMTSSPHDPDDMDLDSQDDYRNRSRYLAGLPDKRREIPTSVPGYYHGIFKQTQLVFQEDAVTQQTYGVSRTGHPGVVMMTVPAQDELSEPFQQLSNIGRSAKTD